MPIGKFTQIIATNRKMSQFAEDSIFSIFLSLDTIVHDVVKKVQNEKRKTLESTSIATYPTTAHKNQS